MQRLFGTDGVRGVANSEIHIDLATRLGEAGARVLAGHMTHRPRILIAKDTRISGDMLEAALTAGMCSAGADVYCAGVLTTPAVAYLVANQGFDAGVMISASHNPFEYNGIKFFNDRGYKLADKVEDEIEADMNKTAETVRLGADLGRRFEYTEGRLLYGIYLKTRLGVDLSGLRIALDCANGSAASIAPSIFRDLGAKLELLGVEADGLNINANCGSTYLGNLQELVLAKGCDIGIAFDGDADRMLAINAAGEVVDGDQIMAFIARFLKDRGELAKDTIVATVMSNLGFDKYCQTYGFELVRTAVGDRYVLEEMEKEGYSIGGEQSGHVILRQYATTGDGILTSLCLLKALRHFNLTLEEATEDYVLYPQVLKKVRVANQIKSTLMNDQEVKALAADVERRLEGKGRLVLRPSGTEPVIRVMLEGEGLAEIEGYCDELVALLSKKSEE